MIITFKKEKEEFSIAVVYICVPQRRLVECI
jgi:hypothetical protein